MVWVQAGRLNRRRENDYKRGQQFLFLFPTLPAGSSGTLEPNPCQGPESGVSMQRKGQRRGVLVPRLQVMNYASHSINSVNPNYFNLQLKCTLQNHLKQKP